MEIGYVVTDAAKWDVDPERDASEFDVMGAAREGMGKDCLRVAASLSGFA